MGDIVSDAFVEGVDVCSFACFYDIPSLHMIRHNF